ncbi:MAG: tRNA preQ1(34) S-adenosylmethionine ribosyltransferase-isomerase QueA [Chthoniobacterales bacterium]
MSLLLADYDYELPNELIAQRPLETRDASRMMIVRRGQGTVEHRRFQDLTQFIEPGDLLVLNDTRVMPARRFSDDHRIEFLLLEKMGPRRWKTLVRPGRKMRVGAMVTFNGVVARVEEILPEGERIIALEDDLDLFTGGAMPLPPYVKRESDAADANRYQTVFAHEVGAIAAPTAGLHFTESMLAGLPHTFVTLHVGIGTFKPVTTDHLSDHRMHSERFSISADAAERINAAKRLIAIGTTVVRVLEAARRDGEKLVAQSGETNIFIHPPQQLKHVDALLTNFHLPRSTLLMLVSAFAGREFTLRAYREAIRERYRFYSYGDCMLIL